MISLKFLFERAFILITWSALIFLFLFLPSIKTYFAVGNNINILAWPDMIDIKAVAKFEKETGIKVNLSFYENNEELFSKLDVTKGEGYDLITITDVGVKHLINKDFLKKIDKSKLNFINDIDPHFLNHYFDPTSSYSIPYNWDIYGLGIDLTYYKDKLPYPSWRLVFDPKYAPPRITMVDEAYDAVLLAALYLFGSIENIDDAKLEKIKALLIEQKKWVEVYDTLRGDYFLKLHICPVVISQSAYIYRAIQDDSNVAFLIPKEGAFLVIDSLVIPEVSNKEDKVYKFLNFLYQEDQIHNLFEKYGYLPTLKTVLYSLNLDYIGGLNKVLAPENFDKYNFLKRDIPVDKVSKIWIDVRAS